MVHLVSYDLRNPGRDYAPVHAYLKRFDWWHCLDSTWLVATNQLASTIRDDLVRLIDSNDAVAVITISSSGLATWGLNPDCNNWLKTHL